MLKTLLIASLTVAISACSTVPDFIDCADLKSEGYCRHYISKKVKVYNAANPYVSKLTGKKYPNWSDVPKVCQPIDEYVTRKNYLDNFCHQNPSLCQGDAGSWNSVSEELLNKLR